jgi:hypothetical protein
MSISMKSMIMFGVLCVALVLPVTAEDRSTAREQIKIGQRCLQILGYYHGPIDGIVTARQGQALEQLSEDMLGAQWRRMDQQQVATLLAIECVRAHVKNGQSMEDLRPSRAQKNLPPKPTPR